jgi:hypothetical protein
LALEEEFDGGGRVTEPVQVLVAADGRDVILAVVGGGTKPSAIRKRTWRAVMPAYEVSSRIFMAPRFDKDLSKTRGASTLL